MHEEYELRASPEQIAAAFKNCNGRSYKSQEELGAWAEDICQVIFGAYQASPTELDFEDWLADDEESGDDIQAALDARDRLAN